MNDYQREMMNDSGLIQETVFDGGSQSPTSVYSSWKNYDSGNLMGSYGGSGGSQWGNIFKALDSANSWKKDKQTEGQSGYRGSWAQGGGGGSGASFTKTGSGSGVWQPPGYAGHQFLHPGQQGGGSSGGGGGGGGGGFWDTAAKAAGVIGTGLKIASAFGLCDERLKVDIAPLESTEVNDALAEVAFFVKGLRECA